MTGEESSDGHLALLAIAVSRVEAAVLASMLEANGVAVHIDGFWHASVAVNSLALGGHRIYVSAADHAAASGLLHEVGAEERWSFNFDARRAVVKLLASLVGIFGATIGFGIVAGGLPLWSLMQVPLVVLGVPVNPQGRPDFFLSPKGA